MSGIFLKMAGLYLLQRRGQTKNHGIATSLVSCKTWQSKPDKFKGDHPGNKKITSHAETCSGKPVYTLGYIHFKAGAMLEFPGFFDRNICNR